MTEYNIIALLGKLKRKYRSKLVSHFRSKSYYQKLYKSYWHYMRSQNNSSVILLNYYSATPNPDGDIGHQMANWIAGYSFAKQFGLQFAHSPFSNAKWDSFLGFGENEKKVNDLVSKGYKIVRLPLFNEYSEKEIYLQKKIISSYSNKKVVFVAEQDQEHSDPYVAIVPLRQKFQNAPARENDSLIYDKKNFNIAIHVQQRQLITGKMNLKANLLTYRKKTDYYVKVLENVLKINKTTKPIAIYLFSQATKSDLKKFEHFNNIHFCLEMNEQDSFLHMVNAEVLINSESSFSYKPALLNKNKKVCPKKFWHGYPKTKDWIMINEDGTISSN